MYFIEKLVGAIAPHYCLGCSRAGNVLCRSCRTKLAPAVSRCYRCHKLATNGRTCPSCRSNSKLYAVRAVTSYEGIAKDLVWRMKFDRAQSATAEIGDMMTSLMDNYSSGVVITHLPTAPKRIRQRGYDQSRLIAKVIARKNRLTCRDLLSRESSSQQHGASRATRLKQSKGIFTVKNQRRVMGAHITLVDDVITTGATLESAALVLKKAGAKRVEAIVFAEG